jgi:opine dehydrogenase
VTIAILGDSSAAVVTAALAGMSSGDPILLMGWAPGTAPALTAVTRSGDRTSLVVADGSAGEADAYIVVSEAARLPALLRNHAGRMAGRPVLLAPGNVGGAILAAAAFADVPGEAPRFAEATGFPALGSVRATTVELSAIKRRLPFAAVDGDAEGRDLDLFRRYLPDLVASDLLTTSLSNTNHLIHPPLVIANADLIRAGTPFRFYRDGQLAVGAGIIESIDEERLAILDDLDLPRVRLVDWMSRYYGEDGLAGDSILEQLEGFGPFATSPGPVDFHHRYLLDDVRFGLAPLEAIGTRLGIPTPNLRDVVAAASELVGADLRADAAAIADSILARMSGVPGR